MQTTRALVIAAALGVLAFVGLTITVLVIPATSLKWLENVWARYILLLVAWLVSWLIAVQSVRWLVPIPTRRLLLILWGGGTVMAAAAISTTGFFDKIDA